MQNAPARFAQHAQALGLLLQNDDLPEEEGIPISR